MSGAYDDLAQESWDSACDRMPKDYADDVQAKINAVQPARWRFDYYDPNNIYDVFYIAERTREFAKFHPREGQPADENPFCPNIRAWFVEGLLRKEEIRAHIRKEACK